MREYLNVIRPALSIAVVLVVVVVWSMGAVVLARVVGVDVKDVTQRGRPRFLLVAIVANLTLVGAIGVLMRLLLGRPVTALRFQLDPLGIVCSVGIIAITLVAAVLFTVVLAARGAVVVRWQRRERRIGALLVVLGAATLFAAALQEEVVFRGYMAATLLRFGFLPVLVVSALVFTFFHYLTTKPSLHQTIDWFLAGGVFLCLYVLSGSIWVVTLAHFGRNLVNVLVLDTGQGQGLLEWQKPASVWLRTLLYAFTLACWLLLAYVAYGTVPAIAFGG